MRNKTTVCLVIISLCLMSVYFAFPVYASDNDSEILTVNAVWLDGDMLKINVTDADGICSSLALNLKDYVGNTDNKEYISVQAIDLSGNKSEVVEIKNPYYVPPSDTDSENETATEQSEVSETSHPPMSDGSNAFTPDGTGTVIDNITDGDGKEFFTINSEDGNVFYLIIDRQKNMDNVYLLNAVTESDLMALAEKSGKTINNSSTSAIPTTEPEPTSETTQPSETTASPEPETKNTGNNNIAIFIIIAVAIAGGAGYYFKVIRGKKDDNGEDDEDEDSDEDEDDPDDDRYADNNDEDKEDDDE